MQAIQKANIRLVSYVQPYMNAFNVGIVLYTTCPKTVAKDALV